MVQDERSTLLEKPTNHGDGCKALHLLAFAVAACLGVLGGAAILEMWKPSSKPMDQTPSKQLLENKVVKAEQERDELLKKQDLFVSKARKAEQEHDEVLKKLQSFSKETVNAEQERDELLKKQEIFESKARKAEKERDELLKKLQSFSKETGGSSNLRKSNVPSMPETLCTEFPKPRLAVCFHGSARSFPHALVHRSQKANLIDALGASVTTFVHMKRKDARSDESPENGGLFNEVPEDKIRAAAQYLGVTEKRMRILDGPTIPLPKCPAGVQDPRVKKSYLYSLAGQLEHRHGCMQLIEEEEARTGQSFDAVLTVRADLTFYLPMRPYCMYNFHESRRFWDWLYIVPRQAADQYFFEPWDRFFNCKQGLPDGEIIEKWVFNDASLAEDPNLPVMVTRQDRRDMPNNICSRIVLPGAMKNDPQGVSLCRPMIYGNPFNVQK